MSPEPITVRAAREAATRKYQRHAGVWSVAGTATLPLSIALHPPTEARALADLPAAATWARSWKSVDGVLWGQRRFASVGTQRVPERLNLATATDVARFIGKQPHWQRLSARSRSLLALDPVGTSAGFATAVAGTSFEVATWSDADFERLHGVLQWLREHPQSGLYLRQLPIRGIDSKWIGTRRAVVTRLHTALTGNSDLGLASPPDTIRLRFLDPVLAPGGLVDITAPLVEIAALNLTPERVLVFENLQSVLAMPPCRGVVVIHGSGYAVDRLAAIPWVRAAGITYWGDLDSQGFGILNRLRAQPVSVSTVLMDLETLDAFADLCVTEPTPVSGALSHLLETELEVVKTLAARGNLRLEQERVDWAHALRELIPGVGSGPVN